MMLMVSPPSFSTQCSTCSLCPALFSDSWRPSTIIRLFFVPFATIIIIIVLNIMVTRRGRTRTAQRTRSPTSTASTRGLGSPPWRSTQSRWSFVSTVSNLIITSHNIISITYLATMTVYVIQADSMITMIITIITTDTTISIIIVLILIYHGGQCDPGGLLSAPWSPGSYHHHHFSNGRYHGSVCGRRLQLPPPPLLWVGNRWIQGSARPGIDNICAINIVIDIKIVRYLMLVLPSPPLPSSLCSQLHSTFGTSTFLLAIGTAVAGLTEKAFFELRCAPYLP